MNGLLNLLEQDTRKVSPEEIRKAAPKEEPKPAEEKNSVEPTTDIKVNPETDETFEAIGEINASLAAFCLEAPLQAYVGISGRLKKKKLRKTITDEAKLDKELDRLQKNFELNKEVIPLDEDEYKHLKRAFAGIAKLNKQTEVNTTLSILAPIIGILIKRAEILIDEF